MERAQHNDSRVSTPELFSRKGVDVPRKRLIRTRCLQAGKTLPLVVQPVADGVNLVAWAEDNRGDVETLLLKHGGILFRNFTLNGVEEFETLIGVLSGDLMEYQDRATPRSQVQGRIYTATDYPPDYEIFLHNEGSFANEWPLRIFFYCATAPRRGGETPIADVRKVYKRIHPRIRERFKQRGILYIRNFGKGLGLPWQTVFQTTDQAEMEEYCRRSGIEVEWIDGNRLRTRQTRPAIARHPRTNEVVWFNHATVFHVSTLEPTKRAALLRMFKEEDLPTNSYYGDGSPIGPSVSDALRKAYREETVTFRWRQGDVLMLDNMLAAHGRRPFMGPRTVVVGMAEPMSWQQLERLSANQRGL